MLAGSLLLLAQSSDSGMSGRKVEFLDADAETSYYVVVSTEVLGGYAMFRRFQEEHKVQLAMWPAAGVGARLAFSALFERVVLQPPVAVLLQVDDATGALHSAVDSVADAVETPAVAGTVVFAVVVVVAAAAVDVAVAADGAVVVAVVVVVAAAAAVVVVAVAAEGAAAVAAVVLLCAAPWDD
jgi:hypothetical protein